MHNLSVLLFLSFYGHWNASERFISVRNGGQMPRVQGKKRVSYFMDLTLRDSIDGRHPLHFYEKFSD
jgi:hypothetical protein